MVDWPVVLGPSVAEVVDSPGIVVVGCSGPVVEGPGVVLGCDVVGGVDSEGNVVVDWPDDVVWTVVLGPSVPDVVD